MKKNKVLFLSSTGGHLSELMSLSPIFEKYDYHIITEKTKTTLSLANKHENRVSYVMHGTKDNIIPYLIKKPINILKTFYLIIKINPKIIVTTGAHTGVPACYIGKLFRKKVIFIETFANSRSKTLSGRLVYPIADVFVVQWESMLELYPKAEHWGWIY